MKKKKSYIPAEVTVMDARLKSAILDGSVTNVKIRVKEVTVEPYEQGFHEGVGGTDDFKDISFD